MTPGSAGRLLPYAWCPAGCENALAILVSTWVKLPLPPVALESEVLRVSDCSCDHQGQRPGESDGAVSGRATEPWQAGDAGPEGEEIFPYPDCEQETFKKKKKKKG